ncbi:MAG TPA: TetR/AcrR family transcriptional regulator [Thermomicrobiales bacterium]|nr:TetR/AcrR family transcriptional regulator [Thermomicrobiales bacterium]
MEQGEVTVETPARTRTRNAILKAAIGVLSQNQAASLGEIADAAGVARSTLHRYFPERTDLIEGLRRYADEEASAATRRARLDEGPALDALIRLCHEYFDIWDTIVWAYMESLKECDDGSSFNEQYDPSITALIERGHQDGTIDRAVPNAWLQQLLWALLYSAWELIRQGGSRHEALTLALDSLRRLTAPVGGQNPTQR